jgi:hypothetical protein
LITTIGFHFSLSLNTLTFHGCIRHIFVTKINYLSRTFRSVKHLDFAPMVCIMAA